MKTIVISLLMLFTLFNLSGLSEETETPSTITMVQHPEWHIRITDWSFYAARGVGIIHQKNEGQVFNRAFLVYN